jgi:hypothetical protein
MSEVIDINDNLTNINVGKAFNMVNTSILFAGFFIIMACLGSLNSSNSLTGLLVGYVFILVGTLMFSGNVIVNITKSLNPDAKSLYTVLVTVGPFFVFMVLLSVMIHLLGKHYDVITSGHVSSSFSGMMNLMSMIIMLILYMFRKITTTEEYKKTKVLDKLSGVSIYFLCLIAAVILKTIYIILTFYGTDGFTLHLIK